MGCRLKRRMSSKEHSLWRSRLWWGWWYTTCMLARRFTRPRRNWVRIKYELEDHPILELRTKINENRILDSTYFPDRATVCSFSFFDGQSWSCEQFRGEWSIDNTPTTRLWDNWHLASSKVKVDNLYCNMYRPIKRRCYETSNKWQTKRSMHRLKSMNSTLVFEISLPSWTPPLKNWVSLRPPDVLTL